MNDTQNTTAVPPRSLQSARAELVDERVRLAMRVGVPVYALNAFEPWFRFHDLRAVGIQLGTAFLLFCLVGLSYTAWGARRKLAIVTYGFLLGVAGFEAIVCYKHAFGTAYSDGFPTFYAFYCVVIPATVVNTTIVGIAAILLTAIPETLITGEISRFASLGGADLTAFGILLFGRHIANKLWAREFLANQMLLSTMREREGDLVELARLTQLHSDFISLASHQIRTPLTSLRLLAEQLQSGTVSGEAHRSEAFQVLVVETQKMHRLTEGLLAFARMEAGRFDYQFENIDPAELVEKIVRHFSQYVKLRGYHLEIRISDDTPLIYADRTALESVIWNLLDNAVKYSPESFIVWVDVGLESGRAIISIRDCGLGIAGAEQMHIFEKYVRGETAKKAGVGGTGLGLTMSHRIVTDHGGEIRLESKVGEGSTFAVLLPAVNLK